MIAPKVMYGQGSVVVSIPTGTIDRTELTNGTGPAAVSIPTGTIDSMTLTRGHDVIEWFQFQQVRLIVFIRGVIMMIGYRFNSNRYD